MAPATFFRASRAPVSVVSISAASHSTSSAGRSRSSKPSESSFYSPPSRTKPMVIWWTLAPVASVASRSSMGRNAILSLSSAPPSCISVVTSGVWQRRMGRPPGFIVSLVGVVSLPPGLELDSCERALVAASRTAQLRNKTCLRMFDFRAFTSILCRAQYRREILREARARQNFIASRRLRLRSKPCLHVRKKADHADVLARLTQFFNRRDRLAPRVQVHNDQFWIARHQSHQRLAARRHFHFHAELLGGLRQLHLEEQIVHQRHDSSHFAPPLFLPLLGDCLVIMRPFFAPAPASR